MKSLEPKSDLECSDNDSEWASMEEDSTQSSEKDKSEGDGQTRTRKDLRYMKYLESKRTVEMVKFKLHVQ